MAGFGGLIRNQDLGIHKCKEEFERVGAHKAYLKLRPIK
jgi:hypothetical protein